MGRLRRACFALAPLALALGLAGNPGLLAPAAAQVSDYEMRYGQVVEVSVDDLLSMPESYVGRAVRTRGTLEMLPGSVERLTYALRGTFGGYLPLIPTMETGSMWEDEARRMVGKEVEVTGGVEGSASKVYILVWGWLGPPDEKQPKQASPQATLEDLVTKAEKFDGRLVTVRGQFRGGNLYGDLPSASRQRSSDWVLKDDLFAVWVSGKKAKGEGWTLDPGLKRDTGKWLQVTGRVRVNKGTVVIQATDVVLSKAPSSAGSPAPAQAQAPPPPPPRPQRPPAVVFSLPLDGERDVPPDGVFQVQFSKDMDEQSFKGRVVFRYAGRPQPGDNALDAVRVSYDLGRRTLQIDPGDLLRSGRVVEILLLPGIVDLDGMSLETRPGKRPGAATDILRFQVAAAGLLSGP
jgi:hypothetical protein